MIVNGFDFSVSKPREKIEKVLQLIFDYGQIDGAHHKAWLIDQIVRTITDRQYDDFINFYCDLYSDDDSVYEWSEGIEP